MFLDTSLAKPASRTANTAASPSPIATSIDATNAAGAAGWR